MFKKLIYLSLLLSPLSFLLSSTFAQSHGYKFRHLTTSNGLSSDYVNVIYKDSRGFIWIGTDDGLNRYDAYSVTIFRNDPRDSTSLSDNDILAITEIHDGDLLIGTSTGGLNRFEYATGQFIHFKHEEGVPGCISSDRVNVIYRDTGNVFWIGTDRGLDQFINSTGTFINYLPDPLHPADSSNQIHALLRENRNRIWVGTYGGLFHFDPSSAGFKEIPLVPEFSYDLYKSWEKIIHCLYRDRTGAIWIGTQWFLYHYENGSIGWIGPRGIYVSDSTPSSNFIFSISETFVNEYRYLWLATSGGLNRYDPQSRRFLHILSEANNPECLSSYSLSTQCMDDMGLLWIGNDEKGVDILNLSGNNFHRPVLDSRATDLPALSFLIDSKGNFWAGMDDHGLLQLDRDLNFVDFFRFRFPGGEELQNCDIDCIFEDHHGNIWIGNSLLAEGLYIFKSRYRHFEPIPLPVTAPLSKHGSEDSYIFNSIVEDHRGIVWFGTSHGLFRNKQENPVEVCSVLFSVNDTLVPLHINRLMVDRNGNLWIAARDHGLYVIEKDTENVNLQFILDTGSAIHLEFNGNIQVIFEDHAGQIWLGTSKGLCRFIHTENTIQPVPGTKGLVFDNPINGIIEDRMHHLWLNSKAGLLRYDPVDSTGLQARKFEMADGLPYEHFSEKAFYQAPDGRIFIGGSQSTGEGFIYFYPDAIIDNTRIPTIAITDFRVHNETIRLDSNIMAKKHIRLKHNQNFFSFGYTALNYISSEKNQYAYYLDRLEEDWIYSGERRYVSYSSVSPGDYVFRVKGSNNDGYWNEQGAALAISILPPPWKTWWAYVAYGILFTVLIYSLRHYDLKRQRLKHAFVLEHVEAEKLKDLDRMKSRFFANISHEFRTPLTLILGPIEKHLPAIKDKELRQDMNIMQRNARRLQNLINQLLDLSRLESGQMELHATEEDLVALVRSYMQQFESLARQKGIELVFSSEKDDIPAWVDRDKIEKILYNLLSNAFKFTGEGGRIEVSVSSQRSAVSSQRSKIKNLPTADFQLPTADLYEQCIVISVSDTGTGIPPKKLPHIFDRFYQAGDSYTRDGEGTGIGLALTKELVELHRGRITVESAVNQGSTFRIYLPMLLRGDRKEERGERRDKGVGQGERVSSTIISEIEHRQLTIDNLEPATCNVQPATDSSPKDAPLLLIVEDNADLRLYIRGILGQDYQIQEAGSGRQGLERALEHIPDLVLTDVMMPEMDGYELSRRLKSDERTSHIPIILLTARASMESKIEGLETGADDFITKPFDAQELTVRIQNLITQRKKLRDQFLHELGLTGIERPGKHSGEKLISLDQRFLHRARMIVERHLADESFDMELFAGEMNLSRTQVHRKLRALVNQSATEFIRSIRLNHARLLLINKTGNISQVALEVGFSNPSYFSECFRKQYGLTPSEYANSKSQYPNPK